MASLRMTMYVLDASVIAVHSFRGDDPGQLNVVCKWIFDWVMRSW